MTTLAVLGAGSWGTVLAHLNASAGRRVRLWCRSPEVAAGINRAHRNPRYFPDHLVDASVVATTSLPDALRGADLLLIAVPTSGVRSLLQAVAPFVPKGQLVACAAKGFELETGKRMSQVAAEALAEREARVAVLSGPNLAGEIIAGQPAACVVASEDVGAAARIARMLQCPTFRVYTNPDLVGVEFGGALKNVIAIGAGIVDGLGFGDNAKAALVTRGLAEITRLGVAAGAHPLTFSGLAGLGDLVATCNSKLSRNHQVGTMLASGLTWPEIERNARLVAEGVPTTRVARAMARRLGVAMPITDQTHAVLFEGRDIRSAMRALFERSPRGELDELSAWGLSRPTAP